MTTTTAVVARVDRCTSSACTRGAATKVVRACQATRPPNKSLVYIIATNYCRPIATQVLACGKNYTNPHAPRTLSSATRFGDSPPAVFLPALGLPEVARMPSVILFSPHRAGFGDSEREFILSIFAKGKPLGHAVPSAEGRAFLSRVTPSSTMHRNVVADDCGRNKETK